MPLYEYQCKECGRRTEKIQKFSDPELTTCPFCSGALERTLTAPAVHFAGGGWYKDLYSSAKPAAASSGEGASSGTAAPAAGESSASAAPASTAPALAAAPAAASSPAAAKP
jgi:putative FmdB family regulatory protein